MATQSGILVWRIPWTKEPGELHTVCGVAKSQTQLKQLSMHTQPQIETGRLEEEGGTDVKHPNTHEYPPLVPPDWLSHLTFHIKQPVLTVFFI